uniref:NADH dehydrogenase subunit 6 n=1 Tax=Greenidea ficicola TaxID=796229 RepID=A0A6M3QI14_9HEMI|nr:NADH dehydrogenase subunit 6 [Greenidea ficicola]QJC59743.1 NADH dehydrogenase subunit 6 [Greenidea ficicola]WCJ52972.1 NADH dehydrogenase subunit 6 [Greenidea ficicola]
MMIKMIILMNLTFSTILTTLKSPLSANLTILIQSISLTMLMNLINKTSWISFMLFILYIGGLMIIFLYISSIAFNELNMNKNYKNIMIKLILIMFIFIKMKNFFILENFKLENKFIFEDNFYFINMFLMPNNLMIYFMLMILLFMLILIIWLLKNNKGPIRQKN